MERFFLRIFNFFAFFAFFFVSGAIFSSDFKNSTDFSSNLSTDFSESNFSESSDSSEPDSSESSKFSKSTKSSRSLKSETHTYNGRNFKNKNFTVGLEIPKCAADFGETEDHEKIQHSAYTICYRESYEISEYSAYVLRNENLVKNANRTNKFLADDAVSTKTAESSDYTRSGFDRGHLAPAGDMVFSEKAMEESFLMSNITPQKPGLNRGIWKNLESELRRCVQNVQNVHAIYIVTGPILENPPEDYDSIGKTGVCVPEFFYKAILIEKKTGTFSAVGFIFPNETCQGTIWNYATTIDEIEERTDLDFFWQLDDTLEEKIEKQIIQF